MTRAALACAACAGLLLFGCSNPRFYTAKTLPPELRVKPTENAQTVNLSRLAVPAGSQELIDKGDVIEVTVSAGIGSDDKSEFPIRVSDDGTVALPVLGSMRLAGMELQDAEVIIREKCKECGLYRNPHVAVTMKRQRKNRITVMGAVKKPGTYELPRNQSDLLSAIAAAEGLDEKAGTDVEIRDPQAQARATEPIAIASAQLGGVNAGGYTQPQWPTGKKSTRINLVSAATKGGGGRYIGDGAVVYVENRDPTPVQVIGLVTKPGRYDFPVGQDLRVLDALALAQGTSVHVANQIQITRPVPNSPEPAVIRMTIRDAKRNGEANLRLMPGDVVSVEQDPATVLYDVFNLVRMNVG
ncbi:MAG TPA: polysaccharide biosynthesis/export family protein, partial [Planctomycetaceae bacterium]|nr:polysaccharide biosynthesis/export family protein [Planctomycetaceae bacterium]